MLYTHTKHIINSIFTLIIILGYINTEILLCVLLNSSNYANSIYKSINFIGGMCEPKITLHVLDVMKHRRLKKKRNLR